MQESFNLIFIWSVFGAGILSFFSPCILPLIPVYTGILIDDIEEKTINFLGLKFNPKSVIKTLLFIIGISLIFVILGFGAGFLGNFINNTYTPIVMGIIVIMLGLHQAEFINIRKFQTEKKIKITKKRKQGYLGAFLLGLTFSFGWTPCIGPVLSSVLAISASGGNHAIFGGTLMAVYTLGLAIPFIAISLASSVLLKHFIKLKKHTVLLKKIGGILIIIMGILLMLGQANLLSTLF